MNKLLGNGIVALLVIGVIIWLFELLVLIGCFVLSCASVYYLIKFIMGRTGRKDILWKRFIPVTLVMLILLGMAGTLFDDGSTNTADKESSSSMLSKKSSDKSKSDKENKKSKQHSKDKSSSASDTSESSVVNDDDMTNERTVTTQPNEAPTSIENTGGNSDGGNPVGGNGNGPSGDMNTNDSGKIVANSRTGIYHAPGQHGYRMNSANAVYFDTPEQAEQAGYRISKR